MLLPPAQDQHVMVAGGGYRPHDGLLRPGQPAPARLQDPAGNPVPTGAAVREETFRQGLSFLRQLSSLRFGRMFRFAAVGAFGTVLNLAIMVVMLGLGAHYLLAAIMATELTILSNFLMQERLVFRDMREGRPFWQRILASFGFNNIETLVRMPVLVLLVSVLLVTSLVAQAATLAVAFLIRFAFTSRVIYRIRPVASRPVLVASLQEEKPS